MSNCKHLSIVLVTEKPRDLKGNFQSGKTFVECEDCKEVLPIFRVTQEERVVPILSN